MGTILSLDIGTSKLCALALSAGNGRTLAIRSVPNDADVARLAPGQHEQNPSRIRDRCLELLRDLAADEAVRAGEVAGIGISGQMHGVLLVDRDLKPLTNLITWRDQRTAGGGSPGNIEEAARALGPETARRTGCHLHPGYGGATLHWLAKSGLLPDGARALSIADFVAASLTGVLATEPTHAASWGIYNLEKNGWDEEAVTRLSIPREVLPATRPSAAPLGRLLPERARELGLPASAQVCSPVGDNQASVIGAAGLGGAAAIVNLGTGGQISIPQKSYMYSEGFETRPMPWGGYILVGASLCGGWSYSYLRQFCQAVAREIGGVEISDAAAYERMNALAAQAPEGAGGMIADTRFSGVRGDPSVRGSISGIGARNLTPGNLSRAFIEGTVRELADMARAAGAWPVARIVASGNAVRKNPLVPAVIERIFNAPCRVGDAPEEAALGAALAAKEGLAQVNVERGLRKAEYKTHNWH